jgi:undecaprenyl-diphosphatase
MQDWLIAIVLGIVEGLTEFLPVSSTGHMILVGELLRFTGERAELFEIFIQLGAILAVAWLYRKRFLALFVQGVRGQALLPRSDRPAFTWAHLAAACAPAFALGFLLHDVIVRHLFSASTVLVGLVLGGVFMIAAEVMSARSTRPVAERLDGLSLAQAAWAGVAQCLSLWPGFSRSGSMIAGGMLARIDRRTSAELSFVVAVPVMVAATGYKLVKSWQLIDGGYVFTLALGSVVAFVVAWLAVVGFLRLVARTSLSVFAIYRFVVAALYALVVLR